MAGKAWTTEEKEFVRDNMNTMSTLEIAEKIGRTRRAVQHLY